MMTSSPIAWRYLHLLLGSKSQMTAAVRAGADAYTAASDRQAVCSHAAGRPHAAAFLVNSVNDYAAVLRRCAHAVRRGVAAEADYKWLLQPRSLTIATATPSLSQLRPSRMLSVAQRFLPRSHPCHSLPL